MRERVTGSSSVRGPSSDWLLARSLGVNLSPPHSNQLVVAVLVGSLRLALPLGGGVSICKRAQRTGSDYRQSLQCIRVGRSVVSSSL